LEGEKKGSGVGKDYELTGKKKKKSIPTRSLA